MKRNDEMKAAPKAAFEPAEIEVITFDTKTDIICTSLLEGEEENF